MASSALCDTPLLGGAALRIWIFLRTFLKGAAVRPVGVWVVDVGAPVVGAAVVGADVGTALGEAVVGAVGAPVTTVVVGAKVGTAEVGEVVVAVGELVVGEVVGALVTTAEVGAEVTTLVVGAGVIAVGAPVHCVNTLFVFRVLRPVFALTPSPHSPLSTCQKNKC